SIMSTTKKLNMFDQQPKQGQQQPQQQQSSLLSPSQLSTSPSSSSSSQQKSWATLSLSQLSQQTANMPSYQPSHLQQQHQPLQQFSMNNSNNNNNNNNKPYLHQQQQQQPHHQHQHHQQQQQQFVRRSFGGGEFGGRHTSDTQSPSKIQSYYGNAKQYHQPGSGGGFVSSTSSSSSSSLSSSSLSSVGTSSQKIRYSKEDMLSIYNPSVRVPDTLAPHSQILNEEMQQPVNFTFTYEGKRMPRLNNSSGGINAQRQPRKDLDGTGRGRRDENGQSKGKWGSGANSMSWRKDDDRKNAMWFYLDPQNETQGPFPSHGMDDWHKAGYFTPTLKVKHGEDGVFVELRRLLLRCGTDTPFTTMASYPDLRDLLEDEHDTDDHGVDTDEDGLVGQDDDDELEDEKILHGVLHDEPPKTKVKQQQTSPPAQQLPQAAALQQQQPAQQPFSQQLFNNAPQTAAYPQQPQQQPQQFPGVDIPAEGDIMQRLSAAQFQRQQQQQQQQQHGLMMGAGGDPATSMFGSGGLNPEAEVYQKYLLIEQQKTEINLHQIVEQQQKAEEKLKQYYEANPAQQGQPIPAPIQQLQQFYHTCQQQQQMLTQKYFQLKYMSSLQYSMPMFSPLQIQQLFQQQQQQALFQQQQQHQQQQQQQPLGQQLAPQEVKQQPQHVQGAPLDQQHALNLSQQHAEQQVPTHEEKETEEDVDVDNHQEQQAFEQKPVTIKQKTTQPKADFVKWCHQQLKPLTDMDVATVTELLCSLKTESEIRETAKECLGYSTEATNFINDYLLARSDEPGLQFEASSFITIPSKGKPKSNQSKPKGKGKK
ncbi:hypothetical protein SAMD00019534_048120, partial [Acytostelium subglobosum LB1]|uniref:hypothetical protein n=1 Tax=Acytostelium subglobosum LB1 TaxID=1410327 RepID=UPI000644F121